MLSYRTVPYLQSDIDVAALAFDVVGIQGFGIPTSEDTALAACLAIVQAFPDIEDIGLALFLGGGFYLWRLHGGYNTFWFITIR